MMISCVSILTVVVIIDHMTTWNRKEFLLRERLF